MVSKAEQKDKSRKEEQVLRTYKKYYLLSAEGNANIHVVYRQPEAVISMAPDTMEGGYEA